MIVGVDGGGRVQGEAASGKAQRCRADALGRIAQHAADAASGPLFGGHGALDGGGGESGQDGLLVAQRIGLAVVQHAVTLVNTDPAASRTVLVQAGAFGAHELTWAQQDDGERVEVNGE